MNAAHVIERGKHYDTTLLSSWPHLNQRVFKKSVEFNEDCAYKLPAYNSFDVNKLFGACFGLRGAHWNSARFGWYYDSNTAEMVLVAYCYDRGKRNQDNQLNFPEVARIKLNERAECAITVTPTAYVFHVTKGDVTIGKTVSVPHSKLLLLGWTLSLYFGGSQPATNTLHIWLD
jgi:hypothetical protein